MRRTLVLAAALAVACSVATDDIGDVMEDGGQWLADAGMMIADTGSSLHDGAQAQTPAPEARGSRLRPRFKTTSWLGADGSTRSAREFSDWFDEARGEPCTAMTAPDGKTRCLPAMLSADYLAYADSGCSKPLVAVKRPAQEPCTPSTLPKYAIGSGYTGCSVPPPVLGLLGPKFERRPVYYKELRGGCMEVDSVGDFALYELTPVSPTDFVEFTVTTTTE